jgi:hypothetical protein
MPWRAAEQLLERLDDDLDRYVRPGIVESMATFERDDRDFSLRCTCAIHRPDLADRKKTTDQPRGTMPSDLADVLMALRPNLIKTARYQLQNRGLDEQRAEDVVQDAFARYFDRAPEYRGPHQLGGWLRKTIGWIAAEGLRRRDVLDQRGLFSLDQPWDRGD